MADFISKEEFLKRSRDLDWVSFFVLNSMSHMADQDAFVESSKDGLSFEMRINGHEVSLLQFLDRLGQARADSVKQEAAVLVQAQLGDMREKLSEFGDLLDSMFKEITNQAFAKLDIPDWMRNR